MQNYINVDIICVAVIANVNEAKSCSWLFNKEPLHTEPPIGKTGGLN